MPWFKLDDRFHTQPKVIAAGHAAVGLYCLMGTYCADLLTNGFVADAVVRQMGATPGELKALTTCPIPGTRPLLTRVDGGYQLRDFLEYNPTRASVIDERDKARERRAEGRLQAAKRHAEDAETDQMSPSEGTNIRDLFG